MTNQPEYERAQRLARKMDDTELATACRISAAKAVNQGTNSRSAMLLEVCTAELNLRRS